MIRKFRTKIFAYNNNDVDEGSSLREELVQLEYIPQIGNYLYFDFDNCATEWLLTRMSIRYCFKGEVQEVTLHIQNAEY